jgi:L-lysine exporter family protein LysE/ArgO
MHILIALVTGIVVALMSSVPVGPINFAIMQTVMTRGKRIAMMIGMGGVIADIIYCFLGLAVVRWINTDENPAIFTYLNLATIPVVIYLGVMMIRRRNDVPKPAESGSRRTGIAMGVALGVSNPVLFGYWLWAASTVQSKGMIGKDWSDHIAFTIGVGLGIALFFFLFVNLIALGNKRLSDGFRKFFSTAVGVGFIVFGAYLIVHAILDYLDWI